MATGSAAEGVDAVPRLAAVVAPPNTLAIDDTGAIPLAEAISVTPFDERAAIRPPAGSHANLYRAKRNGRNQVAGDTPR